MSRRILITTSVAAALLAAAPAFAEQKDREVEPQKVPMCCERYAAQIRDLTARVVAAEKRAADAGRDATPAPIERHSVLDESW